MTYPPPAYRVTDPGAAIALMREHPFAHVITAHRELCVTRLPVLADLEDGRPVRLRGHFDARNPQAADLDGAPILVAFSGPAAYVSPNWRADKTKGGTYDYEEVQVHGRARAVRDLAFFTQLINDLSALLEPQHAEIGDYPTWQTHMAPRGHLDRQVALVTPFVVEIDRIDTIAKLHQNFPDADRLSVADHLSRSPRDEVRAIAAKIRAKMQT
jgi:transcriptional regulator